MWNKLLFGIEAEVLSPSVCVCAQHLGHTDGPVNKPSILLSLPPQGWDHRCLLQVGSAGPSSAYGIRGSNSGLHTCNTSTLAPRSIHVSSAELCDVWSCFAGDWCQSLITCRASGWSLSCGPNSRMIRCWKGIIFVMCVLCIYLLTICPPKCCASPMLGTSAVFPAPHYFPFLKLIFRLASKVWHFHTCVIILCSHLLTLSVLTHQGNKLVWQ